VLVSLFLLSTLLFLMTSASGMGVFSKKVTITTYFPNSSGLKVGAPVNLEGVTIGEVKKVLVTHDPDRKLAPVKVIMRLDPKFHESLHKDSVASLSTVGVLGDTVVDISSKTATGPELEDGDELKIQELPSLQDVVKSSEGTVQTLNVILAKVDHLVDDLGQGKGTAGKFIEDPALYNRANATLAQLQILATNLNTEKGSAGKLLNDPTLYNRLNQTADNLEKLSGALGAGKGSAGKLLTDDALYNNLNSTLAHANVILADTEAGKGSLGLLLRDPTFAHKLDETVSRLDILLGNINSGQGTLGKLAVDQQAYDNINKLLVSTNDLINAIHQDPKKYFVIRLKVF
jgi:phospholipid/cholesterol/gamma-HCH transport system substrate-binding protein